MSRTLEAILSKTDADDDLSVPPEDGGGSVGTRTLLGIGASGLPLPPRPVKPSLSDSDEQSFSVEDVFDDEGTAVSSIQANGKGHGDDRVDDLLDEVAEALNTEASSHDSTVGALPGRPVPPARPIRTDVASARGDDDEFEFEDPDDGPTTLNAHGDVSEDVDVGADDEDEAVVLGPAKIPASRPIPALPGRLPPPAASVAASAASAKGAVPHPGLSAATLPSFPAPAAGRSRLPTPAPGQAIGLPPPGRAGLPSGTPVNGVPAAPALGDSSRRSASGRASAGAPGTDRSAGHHATAAVMESLSSAMESASVVLKKDVKFRVASLAGVVAATFVVGLLIGRAVIGSGKKTTAEASETVVTNEEAKAPAPPPKAAAEAPAPPAAAPAPVHAAAAPETPPSAPVAEATPPPAAFAIPVAPAAPPVHKRRARRANLALKDDLQPRPSAPKPSVAPKAKAAAPAPAAKKKSTWHDPFAD